MTSSQIRVFTRVSTLTRGIDIAILTACPSVRPSVCPWRSGIRWKRHNILSQFFSPYGIPVILVLSAISIKHLHEIPKGSSGPCGGDKYRWGIKISRFSTNKSQTIQDSAIDRPHYGRRIGTCMRSIKIWCHFQWSWKNPNPVFKVTPLSDAKYLTNGYRYGHSYYRRRIGNRTQAFEWHQFQWPWVTTKRDFKVAVLFNVK